MVTEVKAYLAIIIDFWKHLHICTSKIVVKTILTLVLTRIKYRPLGYEKVVMPLFEVADAPSHIQGDNSVTKDMHDFTIVTKRFRGSESPDWTRQDPLTTNKFTSYHDKNKTKTVITRTEYVSLIVYNLHIASEIIHM